MSNLGTTRCFRSRRNAPRPAGQAQHDSAEIVGTRRLLNEDFSLERAWSEINDARPSRSIHDKLPIAHPPQEPNSDAYELIPAPKLRAKLGISAVTLWRWRHDKKCGFPAPKVINGRLYFPVTAVLAWIARQGDVA